MASQLVVLHLVQLRIARRLRVYRLQGHAAAVRALEQAESGAERGG